MDLTKSFDFFNPNNVKGRVHIIGCGSVGSCVAEQLARLGITKFSLYDFDKVEPHNISNQMFFHEHIGRLKTECVEEIICKINPDIKNNIQRYDEGFSNQVLSGYVFLCADSMKVRNKIAKDNKFNIGIKAMFDFRTRLVDSHHYAADWSDSKMVEDFIKSMDYTDEEAVSETPRTACGVELCVAPTVRSICTAGVANFMNFITKQEIKKMILLNAFDFSIIAFN